MLGITAETTATAPDYGAVVPMRFTVTNLAAVTCRLSRLEGLVGGRWEMWTGPKEGVPIPAGESYTVEILYRLLDPWEEVFLTFTPSDPAGREEQIERAKVPIPCPEEPFHSERRERKFDSWTFSTALEGFVYRGNEWTFTLVRKDGGAALPSLPFRFLKDVDVSPEGVTVLMDNETLRVVTAPELEDFLTDLRDRRARLQVSRVPDRAPYQVLR
jgi:hypothetical protein